MFAVQIKTGMRKDKPTTRYYSVWEDADAMAQKHQSKVENVNVQALKDVELEQALYCARYYDNKSDALLREARRELVKRLTFDRDAEKLQALIAEMVFESLGDLYENSNLHTRPHGVTAYDSNGHGVEINIPLPHVGFVAE